MYREVGLYRDEEFKNTSDLEMWLRIARRYHIGVLEDHLLRYRRGHGSSSERYHHVRTEPFRFFQIIDAELDGPRAHRCDTGSRHGVRGTSERRRRAAGRQPLHPRRSRGGTRRARPGAPSGSRRQRCDPAGTNDRSRARPSRCSHGCHAARAWHGCSSAAGTALRTPGEPTDVRCRWGHLRTAGRSRDRRQDARPPDPPRTRLCRPVAVG